MTATLTNHQSIRPDADAEHRGGRLSPEQSQRPLCICIISEEYPPETGWGGIGTYSYYHARSLAQLGHRVHVISRCWGEDSSQLTEGVMLHRTAIPEPTWRRGGSYFVNYRFPETRQMFFWSRCVARVIRRIQQQEQIDVMESPEYHAQGLLPALGRGYPPLVVKLHTPAYLLHQINGIAVGGSRWDTTLSQNAELLLTRRAQLITSPSRGLANDVAKHWGLDPSRIMVIPYCINTDLFDDRGSQRDPHTILYVGRIEQRKGVVDLIDALPQIHRAHPQVRLRIVGKDNPTGPGGMSMKEFLLQRLDALNVPRETVTFTDHVDRIKLPAIFRQAALSVVPSRYENFPFTCLEAMATGCPVVASRTGGIPEMVAHEKTGLLVPPGDPRALGEAIGNLLGDAAARQRLGQQAAAHIRQAFRPEVIARRKVEAYRSVIRDREKQQ
jgi:glycosyltransferase involved in cell wall biosynthesis